MTEQWPVAEFDNVARLRALTAGIAGARLAERFIPAPFETVWRIAGDLENELGSFERDLSDIRLAHEPDGRMFAHARGRLGFRARFEVDLREGWCWMQSRFLMVGFAATPVPGGTLVAGTGGIRIPGRAALVPVLAGRNSRHTMSRLATRVAREL